METFDEFLARATGSPPYPYQRKLASLSIASRNLKVPMGAGKTVAAMLPWLYRVVSGAPDAPRRLICGLPMRVLVEQTFKLVQDWVKPVAPEVRVYTLLASAFSKISPPLFSKIDPGQLM